MATSPSPTCEVSDGKIAGIAVSIGARISALAAPGEVLVSSTVRDLLAGSGLRFEDRGEHRLKGIEEAGASSRSHAESDPDYPLM